MMIRGPGAALRPFVRLLWASEPGESADAETAPRSTRYSLPWERMLPSGLAHVVLRLTGPPLHLLPAEGTGPVQVIRRGVVGGPRGSAYIKQVAADAETVGAELCAGATLALLGVPGKPLAETHTPLDDLLGGVTEAWCDELHALPSAAQRVQRFEVLLANRLRERALHPVVGHALARFAGAPHTASVSTVVAESGYSHRRFLTLFEEAIGITPKRFTRVLRFRRTLEALQRCERSPESLGALAAALGYADQAHLTREFREHTGITPARYQLVAPDQLFHLPLSEAPEFNFLQDA